MESDNKENKHYRARRTHRPASAASSMLSSDGFGAQCSILNQAQQNKQHKLKQRFTVIRKLGKGTYGKVQLAVNKETGQEVAIKTIKKTKIENEQDLQRVRREIQIMSSIEHPHIVHIYEVFENKDKIVLIMQYAPGGELYEYVSQSKGLDDSEARRLFRQIATAIFYCHQNKICHRDLKLENILLDEKNNAKLADFGLSNVFDVSRQLKTFCGSPLYASPEIVQGSPYEGPEVDCWSLGVLLYTLVYGAMPFDGSNFKRLVKQISDACYYEPKHKSRASPLIGRLLCADPKRRATIIDICSDPWVNGSILVSPRQSPIESRQQQHTQPAHTCLLKVAKDMANLTPVRLDILLALTPVAPDAPAPNQSAKQSGEKDDPSRLSQSNEQRPDVSPAERAGSDTLMEVDSENQTASPIASYIVRDFSTKDQPGEDRIPNSATTQSTVIERAPLDLDEKFDESSEANKLTPSETANNASADGAKEEDLEMKPIEDSEQQLELINSKIDSEMHEISSGRESSEKISDSGAQQIVGSAVIVRQASPSEVNAENSDGTMEAEEMPPSSATVLSESEELPVSKDKSALVVESCISGKEKEPSDHATGSRPPSSIPAEDVASKTPLENLDEASRPKKIKKKVVVVKKRKKVVKKDEDGPNNSRSLSEEKKLSDDEQTAKTDRPGKVKIPDTFKSPPETRKDQDQTSKKVTTRRQSALIADVSQKLMQQQQQSLVGNQSSSAAIEADQPQLASVKVSAKKSEFERRASLATATGGISHADTPHQNLQATNIAREQEQSLVEAKQRRQGLCELKPVREVIKTSNADAINQTAILEPVSKSDLLDVRPLTKVNNLSEPITPTSQALDANTLLTLDTGHLKERVDQLKLDRDESGSPHDERSDSVETIKAEGLQQQQQDAKNVRSNLTINLSDGEPTSVVTTTRPLPSSPVAQISTTGTPSIGPAPITRSYKKVTFTKDGTCVTETGRIYSTRGDDGTIRRIERKSKVTHYPNDFMNDGSASKPTNEKEEEEEEVHEEIVCHGSTDGIWGHEAFQSSLQFSPANGPEDVVASRLTKRPFEKLIMPSTDRFEANDEDFLQDNRFRISDLSSRRLSEQNNHIQGMSRADSMSSCSSGSTDVFDDIFDTWTGAISMFNQSRRLSDLHRSMFQQASPFGHSLFSHRRRSGSSSSSGRHHRRPQSSTGHRAETPTTQFQRQQLNQQRCGSVEPNSAYSRPNSSCNRRMNTIEGGPSGEISTGYESDAALGEISFRRGPNSATLGSARGRTFGSSNLFPRCSEMAHSAESRNLIGETTSNLFTGNAGSLMQEIELEHERLKRKLESRHKQFWMGSTPSLASSVAGTPRLHETEQPKVQTNLTRSKHQLESSSCHQKPPIGPRQQQQQIFQSSSSGQQATIIKPSIPLATPTIRNTANLSDRISTLQQQQQQIHIAKSDSRKSLSNRLTNLRLSDETRSIELGKSTSNDPSFQRQSQLKQQVPTQQQFVVLSSKVTESNDSSSAFWDERMTKTHTDSISTCNSNPNSDPPNTGSDMQEHPDARIQNWLLDQSATGGNISSISSGSKSSTSDANLPARSSDNYRSQELHRAESQATTMTTMTSVSRSKQAQLAPLIPTSNDRGQLQGTVSNHHHQRTASVVELKTSSSRQSLARQHIGDIFNESLSHFGALKDEQATATSMITEQLGSAQVTKSAFSFSSSASSSQRHRGLNPACQIGQIIQKSVATQSSLSKQLEGRLVLPQLTELNPMVGQEQMHWSSSQIENSSLTGRDDELDSIVADLESRSSSSLLDQLRSRGYRSMINQRLVSSSSTSTTSSHHQTGQQSSQATTSAQTIVKKSVGEEAELNHQKIVRTSYLLESKEDQSHKDQSDDPPDHANDNPRMKYDNDGFQVPCDLACSIDLGAHGKEKTLHSPSLGDLSAKPSTSTEHHQSVSDFSQTRELSESDRPGQAEPQTAVEEDMDEDVREAKASIRGYLDRMRETDEFIKSMQKQEESQERQRQQQLFLFNNLLLSTKLNGLPLSSMSGASFRSNEPDLFGSGYCGLSSSTLPNQIQENNAHKFGAYSAPVQRSEPNGIQAELSCFNSDLFRPNSKNCNQPVQTIGYSKANYYLSDPMKPAQSIQPENSFGALTNGISHGASRSPTHWRRCKSQLGDQFYAANEYSSNSIIDSVPSNGVRHFSASFSNSNHSTSPLFPLTANRSVSQNRGKRSLSQVRYHHYQPAASIDWNSSDAHSEDRFTTEYKRSFGPNLNMPNAFERRARSPVRRETSPLPRALPKTSSNGESDDDDDLKHLSAYRPQNYLTQTSIETRFCSRLSRTGQDLSSQLSPSRRKSHYASTNLQSNFGHERDRCLSPITRRRSVTGDRYSMNVSTNGDHDNGIQISPHRRCSERAFSTSRISTSSNFALQPQPENSRLSELEQRIQVNKKRREQLLAGKMVESPPPLLPTESISYCDSSKGPLPDSDDENLDAIRFGFERPSGPRTQNFRGASIERKKETEATSESHDASDQPSLGSQTGKNRRTRPSRLEEMEARIKRRSYCVRVSSPDRGSNSASSKLTRLSSVER